MASKAIIFLCLTTLFLFLYTTQAARPEPEFSGELSSSKTESPVGDEVEDAERCEGIGEEECSLMARTLAAQIDYIYTQKHSPPSPPPPPAVAAAATTN